jgi:Domain of unknown function (DUF4397)
MDDRDSTRGARPSWRAVAALLLLAGGLAALVQPGPARAQDATGADATIRIVHASPGAPNVDVLVDGQAVVKDLAFGAVTDYLAIPGGDHKVQVVPTGQGADAALIDTDLNVDAGKAYVFLAENVLTDIEGKVYEVNLDSLDAGKARFRLINASPDAGKVDLAVTSGETWFDNVDFGDASDYKDIDAGAYSLDVKDDDRVLVGAAKVDVPAGNTYDTVLLGQLADNTLALLPLVTNVSIPCTDVLGIDGGADDACVRVVHAVPDAAKVDVYLNDSPMVKGLTFGTATDFVAVPSEGDHKLQITAAGTAPGDSDVLDADLDLDGRSAYEVVASGNQDDIKATTAKLDLSPLAAGQARIRFVNASPDAGKVNVGLAGVNGNLFDNVDFRDVTDYQTIDAAAYTLQLKKDDTVTVTGDVKLEDGMVYDVIAIGRSDDNSLALLVLSAKALVREGEVATPETEGTALAGTAEATVVDQTAEPGEATVVPTSGAVEPTPTATT